MADVLAIVKPLHQLLLLQQGGVDANEGDAATIGFAGKLHPAGPAGVNRESSEMRPSVVGLELVEAGLGSVDGNRLRGVHREKVRAGGHGKPVGSAIKVRVPTEDGAGLVGPAKTHMRVIVGAKAIEPDGSVTRGGDMADEVDGILHQEENIGSSCSDSPNEQCEHQTLKTPAP